MASCQKCNGSGLMVCPVCRGSGKDPVSRLCEKCKGRRLQPCDQCRGTGKMNAQNRKASQG